MYSFYSIKEKPQFRSIVAEHLSKSFELSYDFYFNNMDKVELYIVLKNDEFIASFCIEHQKETYLVYLYVVQEYRKKGISKLMLDYILKLYSKTKLYTLVDKSWLVSTFLLKGFFIDEIIQNNSKTLYYIMSNDVLSSQSSMPASM